MSYWAPIVVQWLHILGGIAWVGGAAFTTFVLWPMIFRRPAPEARALFTDVARPIALYMGAAAQVTLWLGILRGTWLGPIQSFDALTGTPYGHTFLTALVLVVVVIIYGATSGPRLERRVFDGDAFREGARAYVRRSNALLLTLLAAIVACMVLMRFGL